MKKSVCKVDVFETGRMREQKDLNHFDRGQTGQSIFKKGRSIKSGTQKNNQKLLKHKLLERLILALIERCQDTQTGQSASLSTIKTTYNG